MRARDEGYAVGRVDSVKTPSDCTDFRANGKSEKVFSGITLRRVYSIDRSAQRVAEVNPPRANLLIPEASDTSSAMPKTLATSVSTRLSDG